MKRLVITAVVVIVVGGTLALSGTRLSVQGLQFSLEKRNPVTHLRVNQDDSEFQFAIVSDRTGGHRANVFSRGIEKVKLLQPAFVLSIGDLIEGRAVEQLPAEWKELDDFVSRLDMPFFYVVGNHDIWNAASAKHWQEKLGRTYYHFIYRNVLFLILDSEDLAVAPGKLGREQLDYARKTLENNPDVRWTIVAMHRPLWTVKNGLDNGWAEVENALGSRPYSVFCGHIHRYAKYVRKGRNYYQLATTGGGSSMRGVEQGEFDQIAWVTMKKEGPVLANILLDAIHTENLATIETNEPVASNTKKTYPVYGKVFFEGSPIPGAQILLQREPNAPRGARAHGIAAADGSFRLTTFTGFDGAPEGSYGVTVVWKRPAYDVQGKSSPNLLPPRYAHLATSGLRATIQPGENELILELTK